MRKRMEYVLLVTVLMTIYLIAGQARAADSVVIVPLGSGNNNTGQYVSAESSFTWNDPSGGVVSLSVRAECPNACIAVNGACSEKTVGDVSRVSITGSNYSKTGGGLLYFNAYTCWMFATHDVGDPPVGYAQVICYCK